jgi:phage gp29-like protein
MNFSRFKKIKNLNDIKLEKAKLRYDMLVAENHLHETIDGVQKVFAVGAFASQISNGFYFAQNIFQRFSGFFSWFKRKKSTDTEQNPETE